MIRALFTAIYYLLFASIVTVALLLLASLFPFENWYQVKVVLSGSMEPAIHTGSVVVIKPEPSYQVGDVITFGVDNRERIPVTHRIIGREGNRFVTQGDANDNIDPGTVAPREIIGAVQFSVPYLGYVLEFTKTPLGFWTLIIGPAVLVVLLELHSIIRQLLQYRRRSQSNLTIT